MAASQAGQVKEFLAVLPEGLDQYRDGIVFPVQLLEFGPQMDGGPLRNDQLVVAADTLDLHGQGVSCSGHGVGFDFGRGGRGME